MKISIADATAEQLHEFATVNLGLDVPEGSSKARIANIMTKAGYAETEILARPSPAASPHDPSAESDGAHNAYGEIVEEELANLTITVVLPESEAHQAMEWVNNNDSRTFVKRGEPMKMKYKHYSIFRDAVQVTYASVGQNALGLRREIPAFPMNILDMHPKIRLFMAQQEAKSAEAARRHLDNQA